MGTPSNCTERNGVVYCTIPARTFIVGSKEGDRVSDSDEHPQGQVTQSHAVALRRTEVTINEYDAFYAKRPDADLQVVLKGCGSLSPSEVVVKGKTGESENVLLRRARVIADQASCSTEDLQVERVPQKRLYMATDWCREMNSKPGDHPVVCVNQEEAAAFCASEDAVLPPEYLLENASRGVSGTDKYGTPISVANVYENRARYQDGNGLSTAPVCGPNDERANSFGVCDLAGNAWERTSTEYVSDFYKTMPTTDPDKPLTPESRFVVFRGGSFGYFARFARAAGRSLGGFPDGRNDYGGFRCARWWPQDSK